MLHQSDWLEKPRSGAVGTGWRRSGVKKESFSQTSPTSAHSTSGSVSYQPSFIVESTMSWTVSRGSGRPRTHRPGHQPPSEAIRAMASERYQSSGTQRRAPAPPRRTRYRSSRGSSRARRSSSSHAAEGGVMVTECGMTVEGGAR
jgi:hypothetical protein